LTRSEFDKLKPIERAKTMKDGFTLTDPPVEKPASRKLREKEMSRSAFDALRPVERAKTMKDGFTLVD
jgi:hypothetical protein